MKALWNCLGCQEIHYAEYEDMFCSSCKEQAKKLPKDSVERFIIIGDQK